MSQEVLQSLERCRELKAARELVDMFLGRHLDGSIRNNLARATVDGHRAEGASIADKLARAKFRVALMEKYGDGWPECPEWKAYKSNGEIRERG